MNSFGLSTEQFKLVEEIVVRPLQVLNLKVYVFGSRARGNHHPFSDLDLFIQTNQDSQIPESLIYSIKEAAEESNLPFKIDLVNAQSLASSYRNSVEKDLVPWPDNSENK